MNIAVIGWGSLIWCPGSLRIKTKWRKEGPLLPIEFARISEDWRLTLVIHPNSAPQQTYWALSELTELKAAHRNLQEREGCPPSKIRSYPLGSADEAIPPTVAAGLEIWLAKHEDVEAVIWTNLTTNWKDKLQREFSPDDAVHYLEKLDAEQKQTRLIYERAREYVRNAPPSIQTEVRTKMREKGWTDSKLSDLLFETEAHQKG
jgi:hypothetical protein